MGFKTTRKHYTEETLYEYAVGALGRRMRTVAELKRLMRQRLAPGGDNERLMDAVVARLKEQKYLNDTSYAASYSSFRKDNEKFGRQRVITDLKAKGVHGDVIERAIEDAYSGVNEEQLARQYLARKRLRKPTNEKESARIFRAMIRGGFSSRVIVSILRKWDVDDEVLSALESEPVDGPDSTE